MVNRMSEKHIDIDHQARACIGAARDAVSECVPHSPGLRRLLNEPRLYFREHADEIIAELRRGPDPRSLMQACTGSLDAEHDRRKRSSQVLALGHGRPH